MRVYRCLTAVLCLVLLSACSQQIAGQAHPAEVTTTTGGNPSESATPSTSSGPLPAGDLRIPDPRTVDICSALDKDTVQQFGMPKVSSGMRFSICKVALRQCLSEGDPDDLSDKEKQELPEERRQCLEKVTDPVSGTVELQLALQDTQAGGKPRLVPAPGTEPTPISDLNEIDVDGHTVLEFPESEDECAYAVPLDNEAVLTVYLHPRDDETEGNALCDIGRTMVETALSSIDANRLNEFNRPESSFAFLDLCDRLEPSDVTFDGIDWSQQVVADFGRGCHYQKDKKVMLSVTVSPQHLPDTENTPAEGPEKLADKPTWRIPHTEKDSDEVRSCEMTTTRDDDPPEESTKLAETATVRVISGPDAEDLAPCDAAESVAKKVWPKLGNS